MIKLPVQVKDVLPRDLVHFLTHYLLRDSHLKKISSTPLGDEQVPDSLSCIGSEAVFDTVNERIWPFLENILEIELIPTYSYARLYTNGNLLKPHIDRPSCEVSITIQLGRSHHYSWPIYMGDQRFDMAEGDGVIYPGCDVEHWRNQCDGPKNYYSGQLFCHYVYAEGKYRNFAGDRRFTDELPFVKLRTLGMETK